MKRKRIGERDELKVSQRKGPRTAKRKTQIDSEVLNECWGGMDCTKTGAA